MAARQAPEIVLPFPAPRNELGVATEVRTTLLVSSIQSLRKRGHVDAYLRHLPPKHHDTVQSMIAGQWAPIELGRAHYLACEALALPVSTINAIGREVGDRIEGTFLATLVRMAGNVGATPWTAFDQTQRLYDRVFRGGGGTCVSKLGPKDARIQIVGNAVGDVPYFSYAMAGVFEVGAELFCSKAYAQVVTRECTPNMVVLHVAWA
ncbi:MAG TPA: hypothetical protein VGL81_08765 [Polyangiaceae bacterium]|jgi:hypothetical protein